MGLTHSSSVRTTVLRIVQVVILISCWRLPCLDNARADELSSAGEIEVQSVVLRLLQEAEVAAQESGLLTSIDFREGQRVERDDVLAQIDDRVAQLSVRAANLELRVAREKATNDVGIRFATKAHVRKDKPGARAGRARLQTGKVSGAVKRTCTRCSASSSRAASSRSTTGR